MTIHVPPASVHPSAPAPVRAGDERFEPLDAVIKRHQGKPDSLIEILNSAQVRFGFLGGELLDFVARRMRLPSSYVFGVATFYHMFSLAPKGRHTCDVCMGTTCSVKGARRLLEGLERAMGIRAGETTADGRISLQLVRCPGTCGMAPVVYYDPVAISYETTASAVKRVKGWLDDGSERAP